LQAFKTISKLPWIKTVAYIENLGGRRRAWAQKYQG